MDSLNIKLKIFLPTLFDSKFFAIFFMRKLDTEKSQINWYAFFLLYSEKSPVCLLCFNLSFALLPKKLISLVFYFYYSCLRTSCSYFLKVFKRLTYFQHSQFFSKFICFQTSVVVTFQYIQHMLSFIIANLCTSSLTCIWLHRSLRSITNRNPISLCFSFFAFSFKIEIISPFLSNFADLFHLGQLQENLLHHGYTYPDSSNLKVNNPLPLCS